jgi:hypothetical protein
LQTPKYIDLLDKKSEVKVEQYGARRNNIRISIGE